jgi:hypothetical protein
MIDYGLLPSAVNIRIFSTSSDVPTEFFLVLLVLLHIMKHYALRMVEKMTKTCLRFQSCNPSAGFVKLLKPLQPNADILTDSNQLSYLLYTCMYIVFFIDN